MARVRIEGASNAGVFEDGLGLAASDCLMAKQAGIWRPAPEEQRQPGERNQGNEDRHNWASVLNLRCKHSVGLLSGAWVAPGPAEMRT